MDVILGLFTGMMLGFAIILLIGVVVVLPILTKLLAIGIFKYFKEVVQGVLGMLESIGGELLSAARYFAEKLGE